MKRYALLVLLSLCSCLGAQDLGSFDPILAIVIMVKNEEPVIVKTIEPFVTGGIGSYLVYDTGSTDNTIETIRSYFIEHQITDYHIVQEPFVDFSTSRNRALDLAQEFFPRAGFFLMPDAEWYMEHVDTLISFCTKELASGHPEDLYQVHIGHESIDFYTARLFKADTDIRFVCPVHEVPSRGTSIKVPDEVYFYWNPSRGGVEKSKQRWSRDRDLLLKEYQKNPYNSRVTFYLAQSYHLLDDLQTAAYYYKIRSEQPGFEEEAFVALYRLATIIEELSDANKASWLEAFNCYIQAWSRRPWRAEPLIKIARHYIRQDKHHLAFMFARQACDLEYPTQDLLFIDKSLYNYDRYEILGWASWYVGAWDLGEWATKKALEYHPEMPHLKRNLDLYVKRRLTNAHA